MVKGNREKALFDLSKLRDAQESDPLVQAELKIISKEAEVFNSEPKIGILSLLKGKFIWSIFLACFLQAAQQLTGINAAMFYSTQIFEHAGLSAETAIYATLGMGTVNVLMTIVSFFLVDKLGRRTLLLIGKVGMLIATIILVFSIRYEVSMILNYIVQYIFLDLLVVYRNGHVLRYLFRYRSRIYSILLC